MNVRYVSGSHLTSVYILGQTTIDGSAVLVHADITDPHKAHLVVTDLEESMVLVDVHLMPNHSPFSAGGLILALSDKHLTVTTAHWECVVAPGTYRTAVDGKRHIRLDVEIRALTDPLAEAVAPHGLIGQGFDFKKIDGKTDNYVADSDGVFVTSAQGEGGIEGSVYDYVVVPQSNPFSTTFKYGRFDAVSAPPRDVSGLNVVKSA